MARTVLIGLDGATFTVLDALIAEGVMPFLSRLQGRGVRRDLLSTPNPLTPPAWTTVMTGRNPGGHGIFDFVRVQRAVDRPRYSIATSRDVHTETIWSIASRQGRSVTTLNFPMMFPPRPVNGCVVPGFAPPRHLRRFVHPPELFETLSTLPFFDPTELLLNLDIERESLQTLPKEQYDDWLALHARRESQWGELTLWLMDHHPADLTAVLFDGVDKLQHLCWRLLDPVTAGEGDAPWERQARSLCLDYFRRLDNILERIVVRAGPGARVIIVSDHGFGPTKRVFYVNALLAELGHLRFAAGASSDTTGRQMPEGHRNPVALFDWNHTIAYALTAGSNGIYIRRSGKDGEPGVPPSSYAEFCARLEAVLRSVRCPDTGEPVVRDVLHRTRAFPGPCSSAAPDFTLVLSDYGFVSILNSDVVVRSRPEIMGTHRPNGICMASGPGLRSGVQLDALSIVDIAPFVIYSLGLDIPSDLEGQVPVDMFEADALYVAPPRAGLPTEPPQPFFDEAPVLAQADEALLMTRLRALGYVE